MRYVSTRGQAPPVDFTGALLSGLAPDGGLYTPESIPAIPEGWGELGYVDALTGVLELFGATDVRTLVTEASGRFSHPEIAPLVDVADRSVFELFWGPTLSFKDHALQVVGRLLDRNVTQISTVIGATSGDTGSAAIEACRGRPNLRVVILFPYGRVSEFQRRQMTTVEDDNVVAVAVNGTFDDCQALVKGALSRHRDLLAVNSINWARIAVQTGYYVFLASRLPEPFDLVIPTGNFGNVLSGWIARRMGAGIDQIVIANNENHRLADLVRTGVMGDSPVVPTLAPAMDIAVPSNLERFPEDPGAELRAGFATDEEIETTIRSVQDSVGYLLDPHTATAWKVASENRGGNRQVVVATAHPAKFAEAVERATGTKPAPPPGFEDLYERTEKMVRIDPETSDLEALIR
ncbi:MAG: threonine synthase [Acidimicrobiia bacterium]